MKTLLLSVTFGVMAAIAPLVSVSAQPDTSPRTSASDLLVPVRAGAGYSTSGGGYDGFGRFEGFFPLHQNTGKDLLFLEGRLLLDNNANLGGNLLLGYRLFSPSHQRIFGGYLAYDNRNTGNSVFSQIGLGLEALGTTWDIRANAYLPVGNTRQTVSEQLFDTGFVLSGAQFQNNFLLASGSRQQLLVRDREAAMAGFDLEAGGRLVRFGNGGDLRGYGGLYYLSAAGSPSVVGVRARLEARPTNYLTLGLALQHDGLFGTNVVASLGVTFANRRSASQTTNSVLARMGESPFRTGAIVVDPQRQVDDRSTTFSDAALINPSTGQPYLFQHVTLGGVGGNGTFESPFGAVQLALNATRSDGNAIVYVQAGSNPGIPAFTIPTGVQVLSTAVAQTIDATQVAGLVLPLSGSGVFPNVTGTVTMLSDTVLSGFAITSTTGAGVTFAGVNRVEIRDNLIANTLDSGILGNGVNRATILRNQIAFTPNQGILLQNAGSVTVANNRIASTIAGTTTVANPITGDITIPNPLGGAPIVIPNPGSIIPLPSGQGIVIASATGPVEVLNNQMVNTATQGIVVLNSTGGLTIADNAVASTVGNDVIVPIPPLGTIAVPSGQGIVVAGADGVTEISRNTVSNTRGQGIVFSGIRGSGTIASNSVQQALDQGIVVAGSSANLTIANNQIANTSSRDILLPPLPILGALVVPTGQGLALIDTRGTVAITGNTITGTAGAGSPTPPIPSSGQGLVVANFTGQLNLTIANNQIRSNFNDAILIGLAGIGTGAANATITIQNNLLENNGGAAPFIRGDAIGIGVEQSAVVSNLLIENNTIRGNGDDGIDIRLGSASIVLAPADAQLTGTIRNNTIAANAQNGVQVEADSNTRANLTIDSNAISSNAFQGVNLQTFSAFSNPQISANVRLNTLTNNGTPGVLIQTNGTSAHTLCVNLTGNSSNTGYQITGNVPAAQVVNQATVGSSNTGTVTQTGSVTSVVSCP